LKQRYDPAEVLRQFRDQLRSTGHVTERLLVDADNAIMAHDGAVVETPGGPIVALRETEEGYPGIMVCVGSPANPHNTAAVVEWHGEDHQFVVRVYRRGGEEPLAYFAFADGAALPL